MAQNAPAKTSNGPQEAVLRFEDVSFSHGHNYPIVNEVNFSLRKGMKVTLMGQNGAGKSTLFKLITGGFQPESGKIQIPRGTSVALSSQTIVPEDRELTI